VAEIRETRMNKNKRLSRSPGVYNVVRGMNIQQVSELKCARARQRERKNTQMHIHSRCRHTQTHGHTLTHTCVCNYSQLVSTNKKVLLGRREARKGSAGSMIAQSSLMLRVGICQAREGTRTSRHLRHVRRGIKHVIS